MGETHRRAFAVAATSAFALSALGGAGQASAKLSAFGAAQAARAALVSNAVAARATRALRAHDMASLHYISASGSTLYEVGSASGTLPGSMRVHMQLSARFTGSFVIYAHGGSIVGNGSATPHGSGTYESFAGTLSVTSGTGRFWHAHGTAKLYGVFNRKSYSLTIQTAGTLYY
jgi:hypothetical protein